LAIIQCTLAADIVPIRIEASFREHQLDGELQTIAGDFLPPYLINTLSQEQLVGAKLAALLDRQKPRDFYDLYFLLQKGLVSPSQKNVLQQVVPLIQKTSINFDQELKRFLPQSHWPIIKDFKAVLERTVQRFI
jgi:hypothetical protein